MKKLLFFLSFVVLLVTGLSAHSSGSSRAVSDTTDNDCSPITSLPYLEDFSNVTAVSYSPTGGEMPLCWVTHWNGNDGQAPYVINHFLSGAIQSYVQDNPALLLMAGTNSSEWDSVVTVESPVFGIPLNQQMLSFFHLFEHVNYGTLQVGYMQGDSFVSIAQMTPQTGGRTDTLSLAALPSYVDRIALRWERTGLWYSVIIDNFQVFARDSVPAVTLNAPATVWVGDTVAFYANLVNGNPDSISYTWHSQLLDSTLVTTSPLLSWSYPFAGADTLTLIASNPFGSDTAWAAINVINCTMTLPYNEDFTTVTPTAYNAAGHLPACWSSYWNGTAPAPHVIDSYSYSPITDNALCMIAGTSSGYAQTVLVELPSMAVNLRFLSLILEYKMENANQGTLNVGYMNGDEFVAIEQIPNVSGTMHLDTVSFAAAAAPNGRIALQWNCDNSWYGVLINQVTVYQSSFVGTPANLTVDSVSRFCASFSWSPVEDATAYAVSVEGVGDTIVSDTAATLCGLLPDSSYSVRVAAIAGSDTSAFSAPVTFRTLPFLFYTIQLAVNDSAMGSVSGAGTYQEGSIATLTATPNEGYHFVMWDDSVTASVRTVEVNSDMCFTAYFAANPVDSGWYDVTLLMQTSDGNTLNASETACSVTGSGRYAEGTLITVAARGSAPLCFYYWQLADGTSRWYDPDISLVVTDDVTLTAVFGPYEGIDGVAASDFRLYPNPASSSVTLEVDRPATATLFDAGGRQQGQWKISSGTSQLDISHLSPGIYYLRLTTTPLVQKLIVK